MSRERLWCALSDLWLDAELSDDRLADIAAVVRESGLSRRELEEVFELELAPFLGMNLRVPAGEWAGFDPAWVCAEARARFERRRPRDRLLAWLGVSTSGARAEWERVKRLAFGDSGATPTSRP